MAQTPAAKLGLSELAYRVGAWLADKSERGLQYPIDSDGLEENFSYVPARDLQDAVAELESDGYITTRGMMGAKLPLIQSRVDLFATFDPLTRDTDPTLDAMTLATMALDAEQSINVAELHANTGWDHRRFNPALSILISHIDDRRVSRTMDAEYPTRSFFLLPEDRVALKRFVARYSSAG